MALRDLLKSGSVVEQIVVWGIVQNLVSAALGPYQQTLANTVNSRTQAVPLSPADNARLVLRNYRSLQDAISEAKESGISPDDFAALVHSTGNPLAPGELAEALRRGIIPEDSSDPQAVSFRGGIRQGDLQDKWADIVKQLSVQIPSPTDALEALLEGQIDEPTATTLYKRFGGDPEFFTMLFNTRGTAPTPTEAALLANRGIIPWIGSGPEAVSYEQAFLEGPWRNKWLEVFRKGAEYFPPPRTIVAMLREGSLTQAQGLTLLKQQGLNDVLAGAYLASATHQKVAAHRLLALSTIEQLYLDKLISPSDAQTFIADLGYDATEIALILQVTDLKRVQQSLNRATNTVHTQYVNHKIPRGTASNDLDAIGIASDARDELLTIWDTERSAKVALLSPTQIRKASRTILTAGGAPLLSREGAIERLLVWGYSQADAEIFMEL